MLIVLFLSFLFFDSEIQQNIFDAQNNPNFTISYTSNGSYSGNSVVINIQNPQHQKGKLTIPAGTEFLPENEEAQTLFVIQEQEILLTGEATQETNIKAYCSEKNDLAPTPGFNFTLHKSDRKDLIRFCEITDSLKITEENMFQNALWTVSDHSNLSFVHSNNTEQTKAYRDALSNNFKLENPWYHQEAESSISDRREIEYASTKISGEIEFTLDNDDAIGGYVLNENEEVVETMYEGFELPKGNITFNFKLEVEGWKKGTYYIHYKTPNKEVLKRKFEIG